ncbi:MAG TPA: PIN domain-containing protein [Anaeromyxobacteraceae bacterium]|nr:PIN domain-containing protein [Anaeromyxobacteraceae bacterium]
MIYLDTSVALAELFAEDRRPPAALWEGTLVSSRLLEYELWTRVHGRGATRSHAEATREVLARVSLVELAPTVLARAIEPFPVAVRTLDALHLATALFLAERSRGVSVAAYDDRLRRAAAAAGLPLAEV